MPNLSGGVISSVGVIPDIVFTFPGDIPEETGDDISVPVEGEVITPIAKRGPGRAPRRSESSDPKSVPPALDEWQKFFSNIVIRVATKYYIDWSFRGVDEDELTEREIERLRLTEAERNEIARPFSELANKSKFMRRHGRTIVASADSFNSLIILGAWISRVNRISRKHRATIQPGNGKRVRKVEAEENGSMGPVASYGSSAGAAGAYGGHIPDNVIVINPGSM
jgi:hypothetical protein